ncbi:MAG: hypothetical protein AB8F26_07870 [Phycisphaerales bacterium]
MTVRDCLIRDNNSADFGGGAMLLEAVQDTTVTGFEFVANLANLANGAGGAVFSFLDTGGGDSIEYLNLFNQGCPYQNLPKRCEIHNEAAK